MNDEVKKHYDEHKGKPRSVIVDLLGLSAPKGGRQRACLMLLSEIDEADRAQKHSEVLSRLDGMKKTHWMKDPVFWATVLGAVAALLAAIFGYPAFRQWLSDSPPPPANTESTHLGASLQTSSLSQSPPTSTALPPATWESQHAKTDSQTSEQGATGQAPSVLSAP